MANLFIPVTAPAANGSGTPVDFSAFGATKTIIVSGSWTLVPTINLEFNNDANNADGSWQSLATFQGAGTLTVDAAVRWIRATNSNFRGGMAPVINIGGTDAGTLFATLIAPTGSGTGAAVDVSALGLFKTVQVSKPFRGAVIIEASNDGGTTWAQEMAFNNQGAQNSVLSADFLRVVRNGVPVINPGLPVINVGACDLGGGGGVAGIDVLDNGADIGGNPHTIFNFVGPARAVLATDAGAGQADITILGAAYLFDEGVAVTDNPHPALDFVGAGVSVADAGGGVGTITIPGESGHPQSFSYTVTGIEADLSELVIALPVARATALYRVTPAQGTCTFGLNMSVANASRTVNQFVLSLSGNATAGDVFWFDVADVS